MKNMPYNINSVITKSKYYLDKDSRSEKPSIEEIREYVKSIRPIDTHFMLTRSSISFSAFDYWFPILVKSIKLNLIYLEDILKHYKSSYDFKSNTITITDIKNEILTIMSKCMKDVSSNNLKSVIKNEKFDIEIVRSKAYDYFYVLDDLFGNDMSFYSIVEEDKYSDDEFPLRIYGGRPISRYSNIYSKANSVLYLPEPVYCMIEYIWNCDSKKSRKFIRTIMSEYFYNELISEFLDHLTRKTDKKVSFHGNIIFNYITKLGKTNTSNNNSIILPPGDTFDSDIVKELCDYITAYINRYYACKPYKPSNIPSAVYDKPEKPELVTREEELRYINEGVNIYKN